MATKQAESVRGNDQSGRTRTGERDISSIRTGNRVTAKCEGDPLFPTPGTVSANTRSNWLSSLRGVGLCESDIADLSALLTRLSAAVNGGMLDLDDAGRCMARATAYAIRSHVAAK